MKLLGFLLRRSRGVVILSIGAAVVSGAGGVAMIALIHAELSRQTGSSVLLAWAFASLFLLVAATRYVSQVAMARLSQAAVSDLRTLVCRKILQLPLARFEAIEKSSLLAILTEDVEIISYALVGMPQILINLPLIAICFAFVGWLSPLVLGCGVVFAPLAILLYIAIISPARGHLRAARTGQDILVGHLRTLIDGFRELKQNRDRSDAFLEQGLIPAAATVRDRVVSGQTLFAMAEGWGQLAFFGFLGGLLFLLPAIVVLDRATLAGVVLVVLYLMGPLDVILTWMPVMGRARASINRVEALIPSLEIETPSQVTASPTGVAIPAIRQALRLEGVTYAYSGDSGRDGFSLGPIDLTLHPGELVILAGGNGSGKTTMVKVLAGLYEPDGGQIEVDGRAITIAERPAYRQMFSVLFADGHVFKDHIGLDRPGLEKLARAGLERLGLSGRVSYNDLAYSTLDLSQGQRRRLALLNACLEDRPICIFDEWAANQDPQFKRAFYHEILPKLRDAGKALLVISHDEEYYDVADRLIRLREGMILTDFAPGQEEGLGLEQPRYTGNPA